MQLSSEERERIYQEEKARHEARQLLRAEASGQSRAIVKLILGLSGSLFLFIGAFLPLLSLPFLGTLTYFNNGQGDGVVILALAGVSAVLVAMKKYDLLWATGLG